MTVTMLMMMSVLLETSLQVSYLCLLVRVLTDPLRGRSTTLGRFP